MTAPARIQLSRKKGFNLQAASLALNGLPAIVVARPTRWGNPYQAGDDGDGDRAMLAKLYGAYVRRAEQRELKLAIREHLAGHNLACWCPLDGPCHADVLLELANPPLASALPQGARSGRGCANTPGHPSPDSEVKP